MTISLTDPNNPTADALDITYDVTRPTTVAARQALFTDDDEDGAGVEESDSGLTLLDKP